MALKVDSDMCVGCGACVASFESAFEFDDEGKARVIGELDAASAEEAVATCPAGAISAE